MENKPRLIFEEYPVDCNECHHYWTDVCDGSNENGRKCTSFKATRMLNIPNEIKSLRNELRALQRGNLLNAIVSFLITIEVFLHVIGVF